ncbi:RagB/SusD family nutrient uptake outer membrane protein [Flavobacterium sp. NRK1]|uniref:RagB/SusD family nutrient uptake outer membrane protein n=1 Tax=Flavobacterium sp. NRK1 TaxID=2954929 RepID=UPI002092D0C9|nr:RagB/SusD family nutrient uptake outer membrane protein [Flavobacterium sp. NRK1]MCO6147964.1 RagB/SusD family nutrient uptake outer membrane protein [Flavobacterium sp. NRK1]
MKKYIKLLSLSSLLVLAACSEDFITNEPFTDKVEENFYKTPKDALQGLVAVYDVLQREGYGGFLLNTETASDNCYGGFGTADSNVALELDRFQFVTDKEMNDPIWETCYIGIYRANILLEHLDNIEWGADTALKTRYEAEARFLRAHFHFELARVFGDIVPLDHTVKSDEFQLPRQSAEVTYALIAEDFKFAAENLGPENYSQPSNANYGRVTKWAAEAYLAKAFLFYTDYYEKPDLAGVVTKAEAVNYINDVVNNSGHNLVEDFRGLWLASAASANVPYEGEGNNEMVFAIRFNGSGNTDWNLHEGNRFAVNIAVRGASPAEAPFAQGWGGATVTPVLYNAYEDGDIRRDATILNYAVDAPTFDAEAAGVRQYTGYSWKKFCPITDEAGQNLVSKNGGDFQIDNYEDYPVIRFSDVLLMAAELNLDTNTSFAQACIDRVRARAFGDDTHSVPVTKASIMEENRLEFALEGHRWFDLIRQDMATTKAAVDASSMPGGFETSFRTETLGWFALPQSQIIISNGTIEQNPGW